MVDLEGDWSRIRPGAISAERAAELIDLDDDELLPHADELARGAQAFFAAGDREGALAAVGRLAELPDAPACASLAALVTETSAQPTGELRTLGAVALACGAPSRRRHG